MPEPITALIPSIIKSNAVSVLFNPPSSLDCAIKSSGFFFFSNLDTKFSTSPASVTSLLIFGLFPYYCDLFNSKKLL
jgi:hypothetical protein